MTMSEDASRRRHNAPTTNEKSENDWIHYTPTYPHLYGGGNCRLWCPCGGTA